MTSWLRLGLWCAIGGILAALVVIAARLPIDYWDGYDYLLNARLLSGSDVSHLQTGYRSGRPPMLSLLLAPVMWGYRGAGEGTSLWGVHLCLLAVATIGVWACYRLMRRPLGEMWALLGVLVLLLNPVFLHYAPFALPDVPSFTFAACVLLAHIKLRQTRRWSTALLLALGLCALFLTKYPTALLGVTLVLFEAVMLFISPSRARPDAPETIPAAWARRAVSLLTDYRLWGAFVVALGLFYLVHVAAFAYVFRDRNINPWLQIREPLRIGLRASGGAYSDPSYEYVLALMRMSTLPLVVVGALGFVAACRRRREADVLMVLWFAAFFGAMTFTVVHKEARYLLPAFPALIYLQVLGLETLFDLCSRFAIRTTVRRPAVPAAAVIGALLVLPARTGVAELRKFSDPLYSRPFMSEIARWALTRLAPDEPIIFTSSFVFSLYPKDPVFIPEDEFFYFHTMNHQSLDYFLNRPARTPLVVADPSAVASRITPESKFRLVLRTRPENVPHLQGDVFKIEILPKNGIFWSSQQGNFNTAALAKLPEPPEPVSLEFVERRTYVQTAADSADRLRYVAKGRTDPPIELVRDGALWKPMNVSEGFHLYQRKTASDLAAPFAADTESVPEVLELIRSTTQEFRVR